MVCQFYVQFHFSYSTFLKVTLPPFLLFSCILVLGLRKHGDRQECVTCTCLEVSDLSLKCHALGNSSSLDGVEMHLPHYFIWLSFVLFLILSLTLTALCFPFSFSSFALPWDFSIYLLPRIPSVRLFPPPSTLLHPSLLSLKLLLF